MLCADCKKKSIARGIKKIVCFECGKEKYVNSYFSNICEECSDRLGKCQRCGKDVTP